MASDDKATASSIRVELGARAEAKVEFKTEVPKESVGRLVDAITDWFGPFTEARRLRADQIRLQREDVLFQITAKAKRRLEMEHLQPGVVPNKILIPLIEKASCEDVDDDFMIDRWADLLATASTSSRVSPRFVSILGELTGDQAKLLTTLLAASLGSCIGTYEDLKTNLTFLTPERVSVLATAFAKVPDHTEAEARRATESILDSIQHLPLVFGVAVAMGSNSVSRSFGSPSIDLEVLKSLGLVGVELASVQLIAPLDLLLAAPPSVQISYCFITRLGLELLSQCNPDLFSKAADKAENDGAIAG